MREDVYFYSQCYITFKRGLSSIAFFSSFFWLQKLAGDETQLQTLGPLCPWRRQLL